MRAKIIIIFIVTFLTLSSFSASAIGERPTSMLVLGDSISTGYGLDGYMNSYVDSYCNRIAKTFNLNEGAYYNYAVDGFTSSNLVNQLDDEKIVNAIKSSDTILITVGGNDILMPLYSLFDIVNNSINLNDINQNTFESYSNLIAKLTTELEKPDFQKKLQDSTNNFIINFDIIINKIKSYSPNSNIYVQTVYNPFSGMIGFEKISSFCEKYLTQINQKIFSQNKIKVVDTYTAFKGKAMYLTNITALDIHPNFKGHKLISELVYQAIYPTPEPVDLQGKTLLSSAKYIVSKN